MREKKKLLLIVICSLVFLGIIGFIILSRFPNLGAQMASPMRNLIGNEGVAQLETILFKTQDSIQQLKYDVGLAEAEAPWETAVLPTTAPLAIIPTQQPTANSTQPSAISSQPTATDEQLLTNSTQATSLSTQSSILITTPEPSPTPSQWSLPPAQAFGDLQGEGIWQPYLFNEAGNVVALRTFLQPDEERPYAIVAVAAFDLTQTNLNFVLGAKEPSLPDGPSGTGYIPSDDKVAGKLLATFNGGFMATHGAYGAIDENLIALPAQEGYGTVAISPDSSVQIGVWGEDIDPEGEYASVRQNARMVIHNGEINERVYSGDIVTWGGNINGDIVTWRSGLGLSEDGNILYFIAGPSMSMPTLAESFAAIDAPNGILLDINASWVHFASIHPDGDKLIAKPLLPEGMETQVDRYLRQAERDFFYITTQP